jgi:F420H(2)-dependent quinone reductase
MMAWAEVGAGDSEKPARSVSPMPKKYRYGPAQRCTNAFYAWLTEHGLGAKYRHLLTVRGRTTGIQRSIPVDVMTVAGFRWLVAGYGVVAWTRDVRVDGSVTLRRGKWNEHFTAVEVKDAEAIPVLRTYMITVPVTRAYFGAEAAAPAEKLLAELREHPVFRLVPA